ncbi:NAD(P)/FAD-dependent oxidoreductase [bacterium]|nr:NAD(P)/FAD-dependent oxidoreductase [bacterium]
MKSCYDVAIVGAGHNGLIAAGLLAKRGLQVVVLEKRHQVGGAAVTEQPWGPDYKMTTLSYVISLMPPTVMKELDLARFGYKIYPQHGYFSPHPDGRYLQMPEDKELRRQQVAKFCVQDARALESWDTWLTALGKSLGPLLTVVPPRLGSKHPRDLWDLLKVAWKVRSFDLERVGDITRLFSMSVADLLEEFFRSPAVLGVMSVSGIIGTWGGPRSPGTAYVMAHHKIGDVGDGQMGSWGFPKGGMGGATAAMRRAAEAFGATIVTESPVRMVSTRAGKVTGLVLQNGNEIQAPLVITTVHPKIAFLEHLERGQLPSEFVDRIERWKSRSGTVKVNLALDRLPDFTCKPGFDPEVHGGTMVLAQSLDDLEGAFQDAAAGRPASRPFVDMCIPSVFDDTLAPPGKHVMSMFTQWVPHAYSQAPYQAELDAYADRIIERVEEVAPGFRSSILHRQVIGPHQMERDYGLPGGNIFHGELSLSQMFHMRPASGWSNFRTPIQGLYHASSATHGGGGVTGIPALQVVRQIKQDLNR